MAETFTGKGWAIAGLGLIVGIGIGLVAVPAMIDVNAYKPKVVNALSQALGREVAIDGDLSFALLPRPAVSAASIRIANRAGGSEADMVRVDEVSVLLSVGSLFSGTLRAQSIHFDNPRILLEQTTQGANWDFSPPAPDPVVVNDPQDEPGESQSRAAPVSGGPEMPSKDDLAESVGVKGLFDVAVDDLEISRGTIILRQGGRDYRLSTVTLKAEAQSLKGPFKVSGQTRYHPPGTVIGPDDGVPVAFEATTGQFRKDFSVPLSMRLESPGPGKAALAKASLSGLITGSSTGRTFRGDLTLAVADGHALPLGASVALPDGGIAVRAAVAAGKGRLTIDGLQADVAGAHAEGALSWDNSGEFGRIDGRLAVTSLDLDSWLQKAPVPSAKAGTVEAPMVEANTEKSPGAVGTEAERPPSAPSSRGVTIPTNLRGTIDLRADAVVWKGRAVRQGHVVLAFDDQGVSLSEATVLLPGSASFNAVGRLLPVSVDKGGVGFDLAIEAQSDNLRDFMAWQGVALDGIHPARLTRAQVSASIGGNLDQLIVQDLEAVIDTTALRGAATIRVPQQAGQRFGVGVTIQAAKLDLDAYRLPKSAAGRQAASDPLAAETSPNQKAGTGSVKPQDQGPVAQQQGAGAPWWKRLDANVHLAAQTLVWNDVPFQDAVLKGSLIDGRVTLDDMHVDDIAGGALAVRGVLQPSAHSWQGTVLEGLEVSLSSPIPDQTARALGLGGLPNWPSGEPLALHVSASGPLVSEQTPLSVSLSAQAGDGDLAFHGQLRQTSLTPKLEGSLSLKGTRAERILRLVSPSYRPRQSLGAMSATASLSAGLTGIDLSGIALTIGPDRIAGDLSLSLGLRRPSIKGTFAIGALNVDRYVPLRQTASLVLGGTKMALADDGATLSDSGLAALDQQIAAAVHPRWSTAPLDVTALTTVDAKVAVTADQLTAGGVLIQSLKGDVTLENGSLEVPGVSGRVHGGPFTGALSLRPTDRDQGVLAAIRFDLRGAQAGALLRGLGDGSKSVSAVGGTASMSADVTASGASEADLVRSLTGQGAFDLNGLTINEAAGEVLILKPLVALNQFAAIGGGGGVTAQIKGGMVAKQGIVQLQSVDVSSPLYLGRLQGTLNLPLWVMDVNGQVRLSQNMVAALLRKKLKLPEVVPVSLTGDMDRPSVRVLGNQALGGPASAASPKAEQVLPSLLNKYLGGEDGSTVDNGAGQEVKPEKAARDLLKGLLFQGQ